MFLCRISNSKNSQSLPKFDDYRELQNPSNGIEFLFNQNCRILEFGTMNNHFAILFGRIFNLDFLCKDITNAQELSIIQKLIILSQRYKENFQNLLHGDFIFIGINTATNETLLIKSPLYEYHLFFTYKNGSIYLSASAPMIKKSVQYSFEINRERVIDMLAGVNAISNTTFYEDINQLDGGEIVRITNCQVISKRNYFKIENKSTKRSFEAHAEGLKLAPENAIRKRFDPTDKILCELSGGLDSSAIAAKLSQYQKELTCISNFSTEESLKDLCLDPRKANERQLKDFENLYKNTRIIRVDERADGCSFQEITQFCFEHSSGPEYAVQNMLWIYPFFKFANEHGFNKVFKGMFGDDAYSYKHQSPGLRGMIKKIVPMQIKKSRARMAHKKLINSAAELQDFKDILIEKIAYGVEEKLLRNSRSSKLLSTNISIGSCSAITTAILNNLNVESVSPLGDSELINYCLSIPEKAFHHGSTDRYITRLANKGILPESIRLNNIKGAQSPRWHVQLKKELPYYFSLIEKFKKNDLISELLDPEILKKSMQLFLDTPENRIKDHIAIKSLPRTLHVCEWIILHD